MRYIVHFDDGKVVKINAVTFTEAAIKATQSDPKATVVKIVRARDNKTVETCW